MTLDGLRRFRSVPSINLTTPNQALEADRLGHVQMDDQRAQPWPERRAGLEPLRRRSSHALAAARANAAMAVDAGHHQADRRQVDMVIGVDVGLVGGAEHVAATRASVERRLDGAVRAGRQRAGDAGATAARRLRALRTVWLPALGRGQARVARRLAWRAEPGFQLHDPRRQRTDLRSLRFSLHLLRQDQGKQVVLGKSLEDLAVHGRR